MKIIAVGLRCLLLVIIGNFLLPVAATSQITETQKTAAQLGPWDWVTSGLSVPPVILSS